MAPTRKVDKKLKVSPVHKVQTGRIGQSLRAENATRTRNAGKELFPQHREEKPPSDAVTVFRGVGSFQKPATVKSPCHGAEHFANPHGFIKTLLPQQKVQQKARRLPLSASSRRVAYLRELNTKLRLLKASKDGISKRLNALQNSPSYKPPQDARDKETVPYAKASLDGTLASSGPSILNIIISCGFWGYEAICTPSKVYSFRIDGFADPEKLQKILFDSQHVFKSMNQMGIHLTDGNIGIVGYELLFPKSLRYKAHKFSDIQRHEPIGYTAKSAKVLVNTACALREFWLQSRDYASDKRGNVTIPFVARLGFREADQVCGGEKLSQFTEDWRSDLERKWAAEERRIDLDHQQATSHDQQKDIKQRMKAIEMAAEKAMQLSQQAKNMPDVKNACLFEPAEDNPRGEDIGIDLDLDLQLESSLDFEEHEEEISTESKLDEDTNMDSVDPLHEDLFSDS